MECPRCGGDLTTFALGGEKATAVVCESCGFSGVPASHRYEGGEPESWDRAMERFESENLSAERTCLIGREAGVRIPFDEPDAETKPGIDIDDFEATVTVAASLDAGAEDES
ncbi:conserved hypothetical protein [Halorhabdus utahensis DSM 12940]|uniref:Zinc finger FPG/IleRS-type domain-containing protein n=1 Tax=Halorhabdus utahensis (strain DSM 12940 / JCM 11049 / AX-2) TaxID=519442 RepID=C7NS21_HALUD|nr:hypothetical protein [Halorhabdus utahensis]ACV10628.1 conserved hypothetical protein [Halorhabdus utahensis DSM 12940]